jgi:hypothetical protein
MGILVVLLHFSLKSWIRPKCEVSFRGNFVCIGPYLQYVGGDEEMLEIHMDRLSLQEVKGHLIEGISEIVFLAP